MKKLLLIVCAIISLHVEAVNPISMLPDFCQPISMHVSIIKEGSLGNPIKRAPILAPELGIYDHTLYFGQEFEDDLVVTLEDEDEVEAYSTYLYAGQTQLSLPGTLSGDYTLCIYKGNFVFIGEITLD
ncbi:MAG: hypothetical protein IJV19_02935 [Prevotella sp.]|nr:hypothetical protein [Prevotella sp.]